MEETKKQAEVIDLRVVMKKIWEKKKLFFWTLPIAFVLSCIYILSIPRYYTSDVKLAPELGGNMGGGGALSSIASSFGFDLSEMQTSDAITPMLYPDLMEDNKFVTNLFDIKVKNQEGDINTTYYDYLKNYQKQPWWGYPIGCLKDLFLKEETKGSTDDQDPYKIPKDINDIVERIRGDIKLDIDKKTGVISISVTSQDPLICKTVADSLMTRLQDFIIDYRTSKARVDVEYYKKLTTEAKQEYERARQRYGSYADANMDIVLESYRAKRDDLENDMQLKYNTYSTMNTQLQAAMAKVQERTPAFTLVKGAAVPIMPAGPKRMIFVAAMLFLTILGTALYIAKDDILAADRH